MVEKHNNATPNRPAGERIIDAQSLFIDIPAYIRQIKYEDAWFLSDRNSITVFKTNDMTIVLGGLHEGAEMPLHKAEGIMSMQVMEGLLKIGTTEFTKNFEAGQVFAIHKGHNYNVVAVEETIYLLTICKVG